MIDYREPGGAARQASVLAGEGVTVINGALGELSIDLKVYGWFPTQLPSEEAEQRHQEGGAARAADRARTE